MIPATDALVSIEAEQGLLGSLIYECAPHVLGELAPEDFSEPLHQRLFAAMQSTTAAGRAIDPALLFAQFQGDAALQELGGLQYLATLVDRAPPASSAPSYVAAIQSRAVLRRVHDLGLKLTVSAREPGAEPLAVVAVAERSLSELALAGPAQDAWQEAGDVLHQALNTARGRDGRIEHGSGLADLDATTGGFTAGELAILAGRPGMAKSLGAGAIAKASARAGRGTLLFSQEMAEEALSLRMACDVAYDPERAFDARDGNPHYDTARKGGLTWAQWERTHAAADEVGRWPLLFDTRPGLTVSTMEACARRAHRRWAKQGVEPGPVIIDHLGIVRPEKERQGSKHAETADVSRGLAVMAKRLGVPVIALCQLNRGVEGRDDKRPQLSDLRQAGEIEEDARLVLFLYRPEYYYRPPLDPASERYEETVEREAKLQAVRNRLYWIVAKNNNGALGQVETFIDVAAGAIRDRSGAPR